MYRRRPGVSRYTKWCLLYIASAIHPICLGYAAGRLLYASEASRDTQASPRRPKCLRYVGVSSRHTGVSGRRPGVCDVHPKCLQMISVSQTPDAVRRWGGAPHNAVVSTDYCTPRRSLVVVPRGSRRARPFSSIRSVLRTSAFRLPVCRILSDISVPGQPSQNAKAMHASNSITLVH